MVQSVKPRRWWNMEEEFGLKISYPVLVQNLLIVIGVVIDVSFLHSIRILNC